VKLKNVERYLDSFGKYTIQQARQVLTKKKKNVSKDLYNSLRFVVRHTKDGYEIGFYMLPYGAFVDKGVSGTDNQQIFRNVEGKEVISPFKYTTKKPPAGILFKWIKNRSLKGRDKKTGRFITDKSFSFALQNSIYKNGMKGISFFSRPLELGLKRFGEDILKSLSKDIVKEVKNNT
tara:strand:- start:8 stop:538 length:531 start_codon:yes stop_codon:yes gene_type:complete